MSAARLALLLCALLPLCRHAATAQQNRSFSERVRTVESIAGGDRRNPPVIRLGSGEKITVAFDDMTHDYVRYVYKLEHCDKKWNVSDGMFESDYMTGTNLDRPIENSGKSSNTSNLYTHYTLEFPNAHVKPLVSGNYRVRVYDEEDTDNPVCEAFFSVWDNKFSVTASASANTDIDSNRSHQQIELGVGFAGVELRDPSREVYVCVTQNKRYDNAARNPEASFVNGGGMRWQHCRELIFPAGNEFRKFEILNIHQPTLGVDKTRWFPPYYHAFLYEGKPADNYIYNEEINGSYVIRNESNSAGDTKSEYVIVHFSLADGGVGDAERDGSFYVCGQWNGYAFRPENRMRHNAEGNCYEAALLLKQGYYNYAYVFVPDGGSEGSMAEAEGNFFQTENEYTVFVYARLAGDRYDRLLGYRDFRFVPNK